MKSILLSLLLCSLVIPGISQQGSETGKKAAEVRNIILLIGDGMGVTQVQAGLTASKGQLHLAEFKEIGFSMTGSANDFITDSGAAGTAIATGYKTYDQAIGVDKDTIARMSVLAYAENSGKTTGIVVTSQVTHATPASFVAHQPNRYMYEDIALDFLNSGIDVFIGGGGDHFNKRKDMRDLTKELERMEYQTAYSLEEMGKIHKGKLAGLLYPGKPPRWSDGRDSMLQFSVKKAIELLDQNKKGFFLMVEGSQIDWGGHDNDTEYLIEELIDFDDAVGEALAFARKDGNTLVIVTADHETGGMALTGGNTREGDVQAAYAGSDHTGVMVPVFGYGPHAEGFKGIYENTDLFLKMIHAFGFRHVEGAH